MSDLCNTSACVLTDPHIPSVHFLTAQPTQLSLTPFSFFQMKAGFVMNVIGVFCVFLAVNTWGRILFDLDRFPDWANVTHIKT